MMVFSEQGFDLRHFRGRLCRHLGTYAENETISDAQTKLYDEVLYEDQFVWCTLDKPELITLESPRYLHEIALEKDDIAIVLNGFIWEHIIGNERCVPPDEHQNMRFVCSSANASTRDELLRELEDRYIAQHFPSNPWCHVVANNLNCPMPQVLLSWPFSQAKVVDVEIV